MKHCIILHLYYQDLWREFKEKLLPLLNEDVHLYVTVTEDGTEYVDDIRSIAKEVFVVENRGSDVAPFIYTYNKVREHGYSTYLKLQGKKSLHTPGLGDWWRQTLYFPLTENYLQILDELKNEQAPWMVGAHKHYHDTQREGYFSPNRLAAKPFIDKVCKILTLPDHGSFIAGTMFMVNATYLQKLFNGVDLEDFYFQFELGHSREDTLAHGFERVVGYGIAHYNGAYYLV